VAVYKPITKRILKDIARKVHEKDVSWESIPDSLRHQITQALDEGYVNRDMFPVQYYDDEAHYSIDPTQSTPFTSKGIALISKNWYTELRSKALISLLIDLGTALIAIAGLLIAILAFLKH